MILNSNEYEPLSKNLTISIEHKVYKALFKYKNKLMDQVTSKLTSHYSNSPHIHGLTKLHESEVLLSPILSFRGGSVYDLYKYLLPIMCSLCGNSETCMKNSALFDRVAKTLKLNDSDLIVSFGVVNLIPGVLVDKTLNTVRGLLEEGHNLASKTFSYYDFRTFVCLC